MNSHKLSPTRTKSAPKTNYTIRYSQSQLKFIMEKGGADYVRLLIDREMISSVCGGSDNEK